MSGGEKGNIKFSTLLVMIGIFLALGLFFLISKRWVEPEPQPKPRPFVWSITTDALRRITIILPPKGKQQTWIKHKDKYWYFDRPAKIKVNMKRWGGGIPLLLSGPAAERLITNDPTDEQLEIYGFKNPKMKIDVVLENEKSIDIEIGDKTLDGQAYYIRVMDSKTIYTVDYTWVDVLERLVLEPPYPQPEAN